jgi:proteasome alpha subunit
MYASPAQIMRDRAEFVKDGIRKGRDVIIFKTEFGALLLTENRYKSLYKLGEIYDMLCFAATGRYNEFEPMRVSGIRVADIHGYNYSREDVNGKMIADMYSNILAASFSSLAGKPLEVEIGIIELIENTTKIYSVRFDGTIVEALEPVCIIGMRNREEELQTMAGFDIEKLSVKELIKVGMKALYIEKLEDVEAMIMTHEKKISGRHIERLELNKLKNIMD